MDKSTIIQQAQTVLPKEQTGILQYLQTLDVDLALILLKQIQAIDWNSFNSTVSAPDVSSIDSPKVIAFDERDDLVKKLGEQLYRDGKVACLMVAGGQGTRLGFNGPKGCFFLEQLGKSIFEIHASNHRNLCEKYDCEIPLLIMTGEHNHKETTDFFSKNNFFGLTEQQVIFFSQASVPTLSEGGQLVLASESTLLTNPNGHGGCLDALVSSGNLDYLQAKGVSYLNYIQVDNILSRLDDAYAIGLAEQKNLDAITKVVKKSSPAEKVGCLVHCDSKDQVVEYSAVSLEQTQATDANGELLMLWGNTAMHVWRIDFLAQFKKQPLPFNISAPKAATAYDSGKHIEVNVRKRERFIFDLLRFTEKSLGLEIKREQEFAPVKNAQGQDTPETACALFLAK